MLILGVTKAGNNLSGLPEVPTEFQKNIFWFKKKLKKKKMF
jgi:hypothetical protein